MKILLTEQQYQRVMDEMAYPASFSMETFKSIRAYKKRMDYCKEHLKRLAEGSSRVAYQIDDTKVLKLAKNGKGLVQNEGEADLGHDQYYYTCIAQVFDYDENYSFIEMELARKCNINDFKRITGYDFELVKDLINNHLVGHNRHYYRRKVDMPDDLVDDMLDNQFISNLVEITVGQELLVGDVGRISSYGIVKRDGKDEIVLIDYGLTEDQFKQHYSKR